MAVFVGGTGSANQFDDYEEGSWTVGVAFGGGTTGLTFTGYRAATYVKVGRLVTAKFGFQLSSKGSSTGTIRITGLTFSGTHAGYYHDAGATIMINGGTDSSSGHALIFNTDSDKLAVRQGGFSNSNVDASNTAFNNNTGFFGTITYNTAA